MKVLRCDRCDAFNALTAEHCTHCGHILDYGYCLDEIRDRAEPTPYYPAVDSFVGRHPVQGLAVALVTVLAVAVALALLALLLH